jgi:hypothetical protein
VFLLIDQSSRYQPENEVEVRARCHMIACSALKLSDSKGGLNLCKTYTATSSMEQPIQADWTPTPFNLLDGNPFQYSSSSISTISGTEEFDTAIDQRDNEKCVVCGDPLWVERAYIVPKTDARTVSPLHYLRIIY